MSQREAGVPEEAGYGYGDTNNRVLSHPSPGADIVLQT